MAFFILFLLSLSINGFSASLARDFLTPTEPLTDGDPIVSAGGTFALGFFSPSDSSPLRRYVGIWFNNITDRTVVWVANRRNPVTDSTGMLSVSANGTLIISSNNSTVVWSSSSSSAMQSPVAQLLDTGNFVVRENNSGEFAWQNFDYPTDTLLPSMKLGWNLTSRLNRNLTSWSSNHDPSPGPYTMSLDLHGDPQLFLLGSRSKIWRVGSWDGLRFTGMPFMNSTGGPFNFTFVNNPAAGEVYYMYTTHDPTVVSRLTVTSGGFVQRLVWVAGGWTTFWQNPEGQCDPISTCGPFGLCNTNDSPVCNCMPGFQPRSPTNWQLRDGHDGCMRNTPFDCKNGTDGFYVVEGAKLPDTTNVTVDQTITLDECRSRCLGNCSCIGYASADISGGGSGIGCIIWTAEMTDVSLYVTGGQDLYVRLAAADLAVIATNGGKSGGGASTVGIIVGAVLGTLLLSLLGCIVWRRKKKRRRAILGTISFSNHFNNDNTRDNDIEMPLFDFETIVAATDNFSFDKKLGEGGFGPVYKGELAGGQEIAVKRLAKTSVQGLDEFKNEVILIVKLQHRNLVRLLGCCIQAEERMLIYEYMINKSLDVFLFDKAKRASLDWQTRYKIISGIARGLLYLHQDSRFRIIHRDLKASNILLDKEMNPKISDFGMARIFGGEETEVNTRKVVGTFGYMSPEYAMDGIFSVKSDVFSFGVLVLEIVSGKRNRGVYLSDPNLNLLGLAWALWKEGRALELADDSIGSYNLPDVVRCIKVGLLCVQERPEDRPTMASVVLMLGSESASLPSPKQPGYVATRAPFGWESSSSKQESLGVNDISVTMVEGR